VVSVERLWQTAFPSGTKLLAGGAGLEREVAGTATLRPRLPAFDALRTGDLALISLTTLAALDPNLTLDKVLGQVAQVGVSGVAVVGRVPDDATAAADRLGLPLFELPPRASLAETESHITRLLLDWSAEIQRRVERVQNQLTELALQGRGPKAILDRLADLTEKTVVLLDPTMAVRHWSAPRGQAMDRERVEEALAGLSLEVTT
jgi:purine catabolism regulator